jgi:hypothetical protein
VGNERRPGLVPTDPGTALLLEEQGYATIHDLPDRLPLKAIQDRQRRAVQAGQLEHF